MQVWYVRNIWVCIVITSKNIVHLIFKEMIFFEEEKKYLL